jgi:hypothetical protein
MMGPPQKQLIPTQSKHPENTAAATSTTQFTHHLSGVPYLLIVCRLGGFGLAAR